MGYVFFSQQKPSWCLAACLQSILKKRGFHDPSQEEIADKLRLSERGLDINEGILDEFVKNMGLKECRHVNPSDTQIGIETLMPGWLDDENKDILAAYDKSRLKKAETEKPVKHFSLITRYNPKSGRVYLHDPAENRDTQILADLLGTPSLVHAMQASEDRNCGFYVINTK